MTQTRFHRTQNSENDEDTKPTTTTTISAGGGGGTAMRVIVPLQGVVQGRGGLVLGSVIPCALFYFLQLYLKRHRSGPTTPPPSPTAETTPPSSGQLTDVTALHRSLSRSLLSPRSSSGPAYISSRANSIVKSTDSPYYVGLNKVSEDPYDELSNPDGVIQLGLAENKLSLDLVRDWLAENARDSIIGGGGSGSGGGELNISGIATYQPLDGLMELKVVNQTT